MNPWVSEFKIRSKGGSKIGLLCVIFYLFMEEYQNKSSLYHYQHEVKHHLFHKTTKT